MSSFQSAKDGAFPLARSHIVQIRIVALVCFCQSVTRIHFYERSYIAFGKEVPVVSAVSCLIAHVVRSNEYLMTFGFLFPIFDRSTFYKRCIEVVVQCYVVTVLHAVCFITNESKELAFFIVFVGHCYILFVSSGTQTFEGFCMIVDNPSQTWVVGSGDIGPHSMWGNTYKVELLLSRFESVAHVAVSVSDVTMVM